CFWIDWPLEFLPLERSRDRCTFTRPHRIHARDSLAFNVLEEVDVYLMRFPPSDDALDRRELRQSGDYDGRNRFGKYAYVFIRERCLEHGQMNVNTGSAGCFWISAET